MLPPFVELDGEGFWSAILLVWVRGVVCVEGYCVESVFCSFHASRTVLCQSGLAGISASALDKQESVWKGTLYVCILTNST